MTAYRGDPVLDIQPGDPIPTEPSGPFAVLVTPALAEFFLTLNKNNRGLKTKIAQFAADMAAGRWAYPTVSLIFDDQGEFRNGQNRLKAVVRAQTAVWMRVEFGWGDGSLDVLDQGSSRTTGDVLGYHSIADKNVVAATVVMVHKYDETAPTSRSWMNSAQSNYVPTPTEVLALYSADESAWRLAVNSGRRVSHALDRSLSPSTWAAAYYICARPSPEVTALFFAQLCSPSGPRSAAAQLLRDYQMRRRIRDTMTGRRPNAGGAPGPGDPREHIENILRAFKAHTSNGKLSFVRLPGFVLTLPPKVF